MSRQAHALLTLTVLAAGAITANRAVGYDGAQATVAGQKVLGVATADIADATHGALDTLGTTVIETGGAIVAGDALRVDASGRAVAASALAVANPTITVDDSSIAATLDAGATPVTSSAANGAIITVTDAVTATAAQGAITGGILPQYVFADALQAASGAGEFIEIRLR